MLYAAILAQATNLGLTGMARASRVQLRPARLGQGAVLPRADAVPPRARAWSTTTTRLALARRVGLRPAVVLRRGSGSPAAPAGPRPRRCRATSATAAAACRSTRGPQTSTASTPARSIAATVRDATHTLDGILDNQTVLPIDEHTTDTHGYTEMIFGAYDLLGLRFAPRIRDLDRQRLYQHGPTSAVETAELLKHKLRPELITPVLGRAAAARRVAAARMGARVAAAQPPPGRQSRRNPLARALQEYGRLVKTNFVLAWLADEELRRRIGRQLNKGEQLHALRRALFYANEGHVRHRTPEQQAEQALCLSIVVNAIIVWNTVYTQRVLDELRAAGELITTSEIERISPLAHQHIHLYGHYPFDLATRPGGHRPLRPPERHRPAEPPDAEPRLT